MKQMWTRDEIADIAGDAADAGMAEELQARIEEMDNRLDEQETEIESLRTQLDLTNQRIELRAFRTE